MNASVYAKLNAVAEHDAFLSLINFHKIAWFNDDRICILYFYPDCHIESLKSMVDRIAYSSETVAEQWDRAWSTFQVNLTHLKSR